MSIESGAGGEGVGNNCADEGLLSRQPLRQDHVSHVRKVQVEDEVAKVGFD